MKTKKNYNLVSSPKIISHSQNPQKEYSLAFRDLPSQEKPREKIIATNPTNLTSPELLALIFNTGTKKEDVLAMASRVLKEYGERSLSQNTDPKQLSNDLNIPLIKAIQVVACAELGRRFFEKKSGQAKVLRTAKDVFEYTKEMRELPKEHLRGIYLNTHYKVIHSEILSVGTIDANIVHSREVFRPAIEYAAAAVILVHNHPSQVVTPSKADVEITKQIQKSGEIIGITLLDHVIVTKTGYRSVLAV
jgi:DNA repair protein RadC